MKEQIFTGLSVDEVEYRKRSGLINGEFEIKTKSISKIITDNLFTLFNLINTILVVCVFLVHSYKNMLFFGVVIWNISIGIFQEIKAKKVIDRLSILSTPKAHVLRNGTDVAIEIKDIVMDDLLLLNSGNQVCVDSEIVEGECEVDESLISGESKPIFKNVGEELLSGSHIVSGNIKAVVRHLGKDNYVNKITQGAKYIKKPNSEIMRSIKLIIKIISIALIPVSIILCYNQLFLVTQNFDRAVVSIVAAISGMIPGGLVLLTSIVLAVGVIRLSKHNTLAQDLYCIETLARVDMLCLDKTGTITEGILQIDQILPMNNVKEDDLESAINAYTFALSDNNPTFNAIKSRYNQPVEYKQSISIPFSSHNKWSLSAYDGLGSYILGAPEFILKENYYEIAKIIERYTKVGQRVLLFAHSPNMPINRKLPSQIKPMAIFILSDKIRENVNETLEFFDKQGVAIKVISGDNPITVSFIAERAGIKGAENYVDISTVESDEEVAIAALIYTVFGRVSPYQKRILIKSLKDNGHTVAMTGDGVNDVLALKEADCSIAMQNGSDAARNTSQLILMDSDFTSMPMIVAEGKRSINNLQRSATLYLVKTIYVSLLAIIFVFIKFPYPFAPIQMTLIGVLSIGIPSFVLALENNHKRVKGNFIRNVLKLAVPGGLLVVTNIMSALLIANSINASMEQIATVATYSTIFASMIVLFNLCSPIKLIRGILLISLISSFMLIALIFGNFFNLNKLSWQMFVIIVILGVMSFVIHHLYIKIVNIIVKHYNK